MIVENQKIEINVGKHNIKKIRQYGFASAEIGDIVKVGLDYLSKGSNIRVAVKCDYCGRIVYPKYQDYNKRTYTKYPCQHCRQTSTSEATLEKRKAHLYNGILDFCNEMGYSLLTPIDEITTADVRVLYECPKHGVHETKAYTLFDRHKCIECSCEENGENCRKSVDDVYNDFANFGGILLNKEDYTGWNDKNLKVVCMECGEVFVTSYCAFTIRGGQLCPKCSSIRSRGEHKIKEYLEKKNIDFDMQYRFDDCRTKVPLPFDFYLRQYNTCIEYDGQDHYYPIDRGNEGREAAKKRFHALQNRDKMKTEYCKNNGINLIRISYQDFDKVEFILDEKLLTT